MWPNDFYLMNRLVYRNFGDHESFVVSHHVDDEPGPSERGGVRWYELRCTPSGTCKSMDDPTAIPVVRQEGTFAPQSDNHWRWVSSMAMDRQGNIAVGYNVSSASLNPQVRYAGRLEGIDPLGRLPQREGTICCAATGAPDAPQWGDYASMSIDPSDDCTFWYTNQYYSADEPGFKWHTVFASFSFPECVPQGLERRNLR